MNRIIGLLICNLVSKTIHLYLYSAETLTCKDRQVMICKDGKFGFDDWDYAVIRKVKNQIFIFAVSPLRNVLAVFHLRHEEIITIFAYYDNNHPNQYGREQERDGACRTP